MTNAERSSSEVLIRDARPEEMGVVRELFLEYSRWLDFDLGFQGFEEELAGLPGKYARPLGRLLLAICDGEAAGCVALRAFDERRAEMKRMYVRPAFRGRRIGEALVRRAVLEAGEIAASAESGETHYQSVVLDTIQPLMSQAIAMYKRLGFREIPPYRPNPQRGALYMEMELKPTSGRGI